MRRTLLACTLSLVALTCCGQPDAGVVAHAGSVKELDPAQLSAMLKSPGVFVYDCNEEDMHAEAHVPGAKLMVYDEVTADKLPADRNATLVFYCYSPECPAAASAARAAVALGFTTVYCMAAGITGWQDAGLPTEP
ncbi:MAG: rhodanese-like domain-containing protein [Flavobacteriales bacterium]